MKLLDLPQAVRERRMFGFFDDFEWYLSPHRWTSLAADAGTAVGAGPSAAGGAVVLATSAVDNSECALGPTTRPLRPADDRPLMLECRLQYAEAAVSAANVFVGVADSLASADLLLDNGQGPRPGLHGVGLYKVDGESTWRVISVRGGTPLISVSTTSAGGPAPQTLRLEIQPLDASVAEVTFHLDDSQVRDATGLPVKHLFPLAGCPPLQAGVYLKAGSAASESLSVDYIALYQLR
ncbi:MAG: hypothetical protein ACK50P_23170 [Planctomycetaceae bacterium]